MNTEIKKQLSILELSDLVTVIENQEKDITLADLTYNERLEHLLADLITERQNRLIARLTKNADLKYPNASLETLDCGGTQYKKGKNHLSCLNGLCRCRNKLDNYRSYRCW